MRFNQETINNIMQSLDPASKIIVTYLWQNKHAAIDELAVLYGSPSHMHILLKIKEVINPLAEKITGYPLLVFEESRIDPENGRKIMFNWWIADEERRNLRREFFLDLFDEGDLIRIVMEIYGVCQEDIRLEVNKNNLVVSVNSAEEKVLEEIILPCEVKTDEVNKEYKNGILEIKLRKFL